jgi:acetyl esterase
MVAIMADARSAIRWVRANAVRLGIAPDRIAAGGGSAGGHLAGCTPFIDEFDEPDEDQEVSATPDALVLFNPALVLAPLPGFTPDGFGVRVPAERLGCEPERLSPAHHVKPTWPPAIILHGRADSTVPIETAEVFAERMRQAGNRCELIGYDDQPHGFFNREPWRSRTLAEVDAFFVSLGWIDAAAPDGQTP